MAHKTRFLPALAMSFFLLGCESIALFPREDISRVDRSNRSNIEKREELARDRELAEERQRGSLSRDEVIGTVQNIDERRNEIEVRTTEGRMEIIKYDPRTTVYHRDRKLRVGDLRYGDLVLVQVDRARRDGLYADLIRMNDREEAGARRY